MGGLTHQRSPVRMGYYCTKVLLHHVAHNKYATVLKHTKLPIMYPAKKTPKYQWLCLLFRQFLLLFAS